MAPPWEGRPLRARPCIAANQQELRLSGSKPYSRENPAYRYRSSDDLCVATIASCMDGTKKGSSLFFEAHTPTPPQISIFALLSADSMPSTHHPRNCPFRHLGREHSSRYERRAKPKNAMNGYICPRGASTRFAYLFGHAGFCR